MRLAYVITLMVVFATETALPRLGIAQEARHISDASGREADPQEHRVFLSDAQAAILNGVSIDDRLQQASRVTDSISDEMDDLTSGL